MIARRSVALTSLFAVSALFAGAGNGTSRYVDPDDRMGGNCVEPGCQNYALDGYSRCESCMAERAEALVSKSPPSDEAIAYGKRLVARLNAAEAKRARKRQARLAKGGAR